MHTRGILVHMREETCARTFMPCVCACVHGYGYDPAQINPTTHKAIYMEADTLPKKITWAPQLQMNTFKFLANVRCTPLKEIQVRMNLSFPKSYKI